MGEPARVLRVSESELERLALDVVRTTPALEIGPELVRRIRLLVDGEGARDEDAAKPSAADIEAMAARLRRKGIR
jgi:hypothetical protein